MKLKKLIAKKEVAALLERMVEAIGEPVSILSSNERCLYGDEGLSGDRREVEIEGEIIGWVVGGRQADAIAALLGHLAAREAEKKVLAREVLDKYREINLLYTISDRLAISLEVETVAQLAIDEASRLIAASGGGFMLVNEQTGLLETVAAFGQGYVKGATLDPRQGIIGCICTTGRAEVVNDVKSDARYSADNNYPTSSLVCAPLKTRGGIIGAMVMSSEVPVEYTAADLKLFKAVASQAAPAVERAILYETLEEKVRRRTEELRYRALQLQTSAAVGQHITSILSLDDLLNQVAALIKERFGYYYVGIFLLNENSQSLARQVETGLAGRDLPPAEHQLNDGEVGVIDWVAEHHQPMRIDNIARKAPYQSQKGPPQIQSELALPLMMGATLLGVLDIQSDRPAAFTDEDVPVLQSLADQVAIAIHNAALYEAEQARRSVAETMYHLGRDISRTLDLAEVLDLILLHLAEILHYDRAALMLEHRGELEIVASRGFLAEAPPQPRLRLAENSLLEQIYQSRQPLAYSAADASEPPVSGFPARQAWLGVPLVRLDHVTGILLLSRPGPAGFSQEETTLAATFAGQAAIALENARLYDRITRFSQQLEDMVRERTEALQEAYDKLERLEKTKTDFINIASHELRTPITVLQGYSQMLLKDQSIKGNASHHQFLTEIYTGAVRLQEIVDSMLDVAKIDSRALRLYPEPGSIPELIQKVAKQLEKSLLERDLTLEVEDLSSLPPIEADCDALRKVFYHLVVNAVKYTPDGGRITVTGHCPPHHAEEWPDDSVEIIISDTGIGIDPDFHELIFTKFYQTGELALHSTGKTKFKGSGPGLGLAIVRGIVDAHGGQVWVESSGYDEKSCPGSKFHVVLPLRHSGPDPKVGIGIAAAVPT